MPDKIVERIKQVKKKLNLTQQTLADAGNISKGTVRNIFSGSSTPNVTALHGWAQNLDLNLNWLISGEGEMFRSKGRFKEVRPDEFARGNVQPDMALKDDDGNMVVVETKQHGPVTRHVNTLENGLKHSGLTTVISVVLEELQSWRMKELKKNQGVVREGSPTYAHEDEADFTPGDACGIDAAPSIGELKANQSGRRIRVRNSESNK